MLAAQSIFLWGWNWFDWFVALALAYGVWTGIRNGLSGELLWLTGVVLMLVVGINFYQPVGNWVHGLTGWSMEVANLLSFVALCLTVYVITLSIRQILHDRRKQRSLSSATIENLGGAVTGTIRWGLIMAILTLTLCLTRSEFWQQQIGVDSRFGSYVVAKFPSVTEFMQRQFPEKMWFLDDVHRREDPDLPPTVPEQK